MSIQGSHVQGEANRTQIALRQAIKPVAQTLFSWAIKHVDFNKTSSLDEAFFGTPSA